MGGIQETHSVPNVGRSPIGVEQKAPRALLGRERECDAIDRLLRAARDGHGEAIVLHGEPGIGKTALLEYATDGAPDFQVLRAVGNEAELALPFAALQQLCSPGLASLEQLPEPQRDSLQVAFGLTAGPAPDRLLVGLAVLNLLSQLGTERPVLCVVDDTQWLDRESAQAFAFVARRLMTERIALVFATRSITDEVRRLPELIVDGLGDVAATTLLRSVLPNRVDERVLERFVAEAHGNPLALLELPRGLTPGQLAGGFALPVSDTPHRSHRSELSATAHEDARGITAPVAHRGRRTDRRPIARLARWLSCSVSTNRPRRRSRPKDCWTSVRASCSHTRSCAPRSIERRRPRTGARRTVRSRRQLTPPSTPTVTRGTARRPRHAPTRMSPRSWSSRPGEQRRGVVSRPRPRSWSVRPSSVSIQHRVHVVRSSPPKTSAKPARSTPPSCSRRSRSKVR